MAGHPTLLEASALAQTCASLGYHLQARLLARAAGQPGKVPPAVEQIAALAAELPAHPLSAFGGLVKGKVPGKKGPKAEANGGGSEDNGGGGGGGTGVKRPRAIWSDERQGELVRLVDDDEYRKAQMGEGGACHRWVRVGSRWDEARRRRWQTLEPAGTGRRFGSAAAGSRPLGRPCRCWRARLGSGRTPPEQSGGTLHSSQLAAASSSSPPLPCPLPSPVPLPSLPHDALSLSLSPPSPSPLPPGAGKDAERGGSLNWAALARHLGVATPATVHRQYNLAKGLPAGEGGCCTASL